MGTWRRPGHILQEGYPGGGWWTGTYAVDLSLGMTITSLIPLLIALAPPVINLLDSSILWHAIIHIFDLNKCFHKWCFSPQAVRPLLVILDTSGDILYRKGEICLRAPLLAWQIFSSLVNTLSEKKKNANREELKQWLAFGIFFVLISIYFVYSFS